jgi:hypothetical protein
MMPWLSCWMHCRSPRNLKRRLPWNRKRNLADPLLSQPASRIRRTTYWVGDKPVSLVYIPALAEEHPETINDKAASTLGSNNCRELRGCNTQNRKSKVLISRVDG